MDDNEDYFIQLPVGYKEDKQDDQQDRPLFTHQSEEQEDQRQSKDRYGQYESQNDEVIDEELLTKMSQLHESLRNKKLLEFELIQAKIMKDQNLKDCNSILQDIQKLKIQTIQAQIENKSNQKDIEQLQKEIEWQKAQNRRHLKQIEEINHAIMKSKQKKEQILNREEFKENISSQNKFISVEKMRLVAENQSKEQIIGQIKVIIAEMKAKIVKKEQQNKQLEDEYQLLLEQIKQQDKKEQKRQKNKIALTQPNIKMNAAEKKVNLSLCHHQQSTQHQISRSTASIKHEFKSNRRTDQSYLSLAKPQKIVQNDQKSIAGSTKTKKKDKIKSFR